MKVRKTLINAPVIAFALISTSAFSHDGYGPGSHGMGMMGGQGMQAGVGSVKVWPGHMTPQQLGRIEEHILFMHKGRNKIAEQTDPEAQRGLVKEHHASMQVFMHGRVKMMRESMERNSHSQD